MQIPCKSFLVTNKVAMSISHKELTTNIGYVMYGDYLFMVKFMINRLHCYCIILHFKVKVWFYVFTEIIIYFCKNISEIILPCVFSSINANINIVCYQNSFFCSKIYTVSIPGLRKRHKLNHITISMQNSVVTRLRHRMPLRSKLASFPTT